MSAPLGVEYFGFVEGVGMGNLMWPGDFKMRAGRFPAKHPCGGQREGERMRMQLGGSDALDAFRALGYYASCFPEGDGLAFKPPPEKTTAQIVADIESCFGWSVELVRP